MQKNFTLHFNKDVFPIKKSRLSTQIYILTQFTFATHLNASSSENNRHYFRITMPFRKYNNIVRLVYELMQCHYYQEFKSIFQYFSRQREKEKKTMIARNVFGLGRYKRNVERGFTAGQSYPMLSTKWSRVPRKSSKIIKQRPGSSGKQD